jgi:hypothetical protein
MAGPGVTCYANGIRVGIADHELFGRHRVDGGAGVRAALFNVSRVPLPLGSGPDKTGLDVLFKRRPYDVGY